jgi:aspartate ammonia-lyase
MRTLEESGEACRTETDNLGTMSLPADTLWGIHTARAVLNFPISGRTLGQLPELVHSLGSVKLACALANHQLGLLDARRCGAISHACERVRAGGLDSHFVVDLMQGGAGTSSNMNANEVIANAALQFMGLPAGCYGELHPNDHVNASQSTNDVYPSALRLALHAGLQPLMQEAQALHGALQTQATRNAMVLKIGRTQLQDAVPMTVGQEFGAWATTVAGDVAALQRAASGLDTLNLGGTAVGTGLNAPAGFGRLAIDHLSQLLGRPLRQADNLVHAGQDTAALLDLSAALRRVAVHLGKMANDLRLLASGPQAGFADLKLPARQAGSSIMPGKVNPVIPEAVNQVVFDVIGGDLTVALACEAGQLQLNAFEPLVGATLLRHLGQLSRTVCLLRTHCIEGIEVPAAALAARVDDSATLATALVPAIGYVASARVAAEALRSGQTVLAVAMAQDGANENALRECLRPQVLASARR